MRQSIPCCLALCLLALAPPPALAQVPGPAAIEALLNRTADQLTAEAPEGKGYSYYTYGSKELRYAIGDLDGDGAEDLALIDGNLLPRDLRVPGRAVVKGDALSLSIAAASILAKTARDAVMVDLAQQFPGYGWDRNAGYPTPSHKRALLELGVTPYHRRSFGPVHNILCKVPSPTD